MECPSCKRENPSGSRFCLGCGSPLARSCTGCGQELPPDAAFCNSCGEPIQAVTQPPRVREAPELDPRAYTPKHLADKILQSKSALEGERKQVTVLFADVKGSMELAESLDPEEWHALLDRFFQILTDGVHRFEGMVNQYTGDGIMALFGAPIAHEDHAQRACYAALHLRGALRGYADELRRSRGISFSTRIGLNSGEVVVGKIGDDLRMDYTAQGHTVGLAQRMEQLAEPGQVFLTGNTATLVRGYFDLRDLGEFELKGASAAIPVSALEGVGEMRTRLEVSRARGFSRFVGRAAELAALERALERARSGERVVVGIVGEAGVGKSRLAHEFLEAARTDDMRIGTAHCVSHGRQTPLLPWVEAMRSYFGIVDRDPDEVAREKVGGRMLRLDPALATDVPLMLDLLGVPDPRQPIAAMEPEEYQQRLVEVLARLSDRRSAVEPAIFFWEDMHWVDRASESVITALLPAGGGRSLSLITFRPEYQWPLASDSSYEQLVVRPLSDADVDELLEDLLGAELARCPLARRIRERAGGTPFFAEELVQSLAEVGVLEGQRGDYRLAGPEDTITLPASVQAVLAARIDRLPEREKHVLQAASVIGRAFPVQLLREIVELPDADLDPALSALCDAELLYQQALYPEAEYTFKHPLTQEVAYHSQLTERRSRQHRALARALDALHAASPGERAALIAHHFENAGEDLEAARWHRRAAAWLAARNRIEQTHHLHRVLSLLEDQPENEQALAWGLAARASLIRAGINTGMDEAEGDRLFEEARRLAERIEDRTALVMLYAVAGVFKGVHGDPVTALERCQEALRLAEGIGDEAVELVLRASAAGGYAGVGRLVDGLRFTERSLEQLPRDDDLGARLSGFSPRLMLRAWRGWFLGRVGRLAESEDEIRAVLEAVRDPSRDREVLYECHTTLVYIAWLRGDRAGATSAAREAARIGERLYVRTREIYSLREALLAERWAEAVAHIEGSPDRHREVGLGEFDELASEAYLRHGEQGQARTHAERALQLAETRRSATLRAGGLLALARVELSTGAADRARELLDEALRCADEAHAGARVPFIKYARAEAARALGDDTARARELREAHRLFIEMGATGHAEQVARELGGAS